MCAPSLPDGTCRLRRDEPEEGSAAAGVEHGHDAARNDLGEKASGASEVVKDHGAMVSVCEEVVSILQEIQNGVLAVVMDPEVMANVCDEEASALEESVRRREA